MVSLPRFAPYVGLETLSSENCVINLWEFLSPLDALTEEMNRRVTLNAINILSPFL